METIGNMPQLNAFEKKFGKGQTMLSVLKTQCGKEPGDGKLVPQKVINVLKSLERSGGSGGLAFEREIQYNKAIREIKDEKLENMRDGLTKVKICALFVDAFNSLGHVHEITRGPFYRQLMAGKDFMIERLAICCLRRDAIEAGVRCGIGEDFSKECRDWRDGKSYSIPTFELDIPGVGHLVWHLGSREKAENLRAFMARCAIDHGWIKTQNKEKTVALARKDEEFFKYPYSRKIDERKRDSEGFAYSNISLLTGWDGENLSKADKNLQFYGVVDPETQLDKQGKIKPINPKKIYGFDSLEEKSI